MSFTVYSPAGRAMNLGQTLDVLQAFGHFGEREPGAPPLPPRRRRSSPSIASNSTTTNRVLLARLAEYHVAPPT